jgi:hypothetical protein
VVGGSPDEEDLDDFRDGVYLIASDGSELDVAEAAAASGDTLIVSPWNTGGLWLYQEPTGE